VKDIKRRILDTVSDLVGGFLYYDRKEDENLPRGAIEKALSKGEITFEEIENAFSSELRRGLQP
jgi:hypothetical protein